MAATAKVEMKECRITAGFKDRELCIRELLSATPNPGQLHKYEVAHVRRAILLAMRIAAFILLVGASASAGGQSIASTPQEANAVWQMQDSGSTAGLRGIDSVDGTIAWASGTGGAVFKTTDGGLHWQHCATPDAATDGATLDFRGVQAWDAQTAIVMASGPGYRSRLYKTTDGCKSWKLVFRNLDKDGFWDAIRITGAKTAFMIGDPVPPKELDRSKVRQFYHFPLYGTTDAGDTWNRLDKNDLFAASDNNGKPAQSIFAASNSSLLETAHHRWILFVVGGKTASLKLLEFIDNPNSVICKHACTVTSGAELPLRSGPTAGGFSLAARDGDSVDPVLIAVGGDYQTPKKSEGTSATCTRNANELLSTIFTCDASTIPPHGYRSTVQWSESLKLWIAAGTNGSDISRDDGRTWQPLDDGNWNALSLPFIVGPGGRIARLNSTALQNP